MNCLCCGKPLPIEDEPDGWHKRCIRRFFGISALPDIEINDAALELLASESTSKGFTVPGVQKKLSLHLLSSSKTPRLTLVNYPTGYILKPQVDAFTALPESEHLVMSMADAAGISTVPHALIRKGNDLAYITKRVDRERCAKIIQRWSSRRGFDMSELFMRIVFSYITGNSDMHLKNFSLIETSEGTEEYVLSPAYDLLPVNVIMPEDQEEMALALNGKKTHLRKNDFLIFADKCGIARAPAEKMIAKLVSMKFLFSQMCAQSLLPDTLKHQFDTLMENRCSVLTQ